MCGAQGQGTGVQVGRRPGLVVGVLGGCGC